MVFIKVFYSKSFVNVRVSVSSVLSLVFQIEFPENRKRLNRVLFKKHSKLIIPYLKDMN